MNKRPDGLSKSVAIRNVEKRKLGGEGAGKAEWEAARQQEKLQKYGGRKWQQKEQERRDDSLLMWGGWGRWGKCGRGRRACSLTTLPL